MVDLFKYDVSGLDNIFDENAQDSGTDEQLEFMDFTISAPAPAIEQSDPIEEIVEEFPHSDPPEDSFTSALTSPYVAPVAGVYDAALNTGRFVHDTVDWLGKHFDTAAKIDSFIDSFPSMPEWPATRGAIGKGGRAITSFIASAYSPAKFLKAYNALVRGGVSAGVAGATAFPADAPNAANLIQQLADGSERMESIFKSLPRPMQDILRALPNIDEGHPLYRRLKNGGVEAMFGVPFDVLMSAARVFRAGRDARKLANEDSAVLAEKAKAKGDPVFQATAKVDPDVANARELLDNLDRAETNGNAQQIQQAKQRIEKFKKTNPEGAQLLDPAFTGDLGLGKGTLKSWGVPSLKPNSFRQQGKGGIYEGSEQFIDKGLLAKAIASKNFDLAKYILHPANNTYKPQLMENITKMVENIQKEILGKVPGRPSQRKEAVKDLTAFEQDLKAVEGSDTYMASSLLRSMEYGPKTVKDALVLDIIRSAQGMQSWHLMKRALAGDSTAARMLPTQLAIGAEVEAIVRASKSPLNKEMLRQLDQSVSLQYSEDYSRRMMNSPKMLRDQALPDDVSGFGFGKSFNKDATDMMMRHAEMVPEFDGLDLAFRLNMLRNPQQYKALIGQMSRPGMFDALLEGFYNAILSSPVTILGNFVSSHLFALYQIPVRALAGVIGVVDSALVGRSANDVRVGEFMAMTGGYMRGGVNQLMPLAKNLAAVATLRKPLSPSGLQKFEAYPREAWNAEGLAPAISALDKIMDNATRGALNVKTPLEWFANSTGRVVRTTQSLFATADEMNRAVAFDMARHAQAYRAVANSGKSPLGNMREMQKHIDNIPTDKGEAYDMSTMIAFVDEVEASAGLRDFIDDYPALRVMFPFVRSQASIYSAWVNNTPFAVVSPRFHKALKAGGAERQLALSRLMLGSAWTYGIYEGWASGRLTGSGIQKGAQRAMMSRMGWQPTSVLVDGDSYLANMFQIERSMEARLDRVIDGDTIDVRDADGEVHRIRIKGLDTAELGTFEGEDAKDVLRSVFSANQTLTIKWSKKAAKRSGTESWGDRLLGTVYLNGVDIGETMIAKGAGQFRPEAAKYVSLRAFEPFATHLNAMVDAFDTLHTIDDKEDRDALWQVMFENVAGNLLDKQYTKGFSTLVDVLQGKGGDRLLSTFVPSIVSDVSRHLDPTHRDFRTIDPTLTPEHGAMTSTLNNIIAKTPLASSFLIEDYDGLGHIGVKPPSWGQSFFNIIPTKAQVYNKVWAEFAVNNYFPKKLKPELDGAPLLLHEYRDLQRLLGTVKLSGRTLMEEMIFAVDNFSELDTRGPDGYRREKLSAVRHAYKQEAERQTKDLYPEIFERIYAVDLEDEEAINQDNPMILDKTTERLLQSQRSLNQ